jgi:hypothetical protein
MIHMIVQQFQRLLGESSTCLVLPSYLADTALRSHRHGEGLTIVIQQV